MAGPDDGRARFRAEGLRDFMTAVLVHYGFSEPDARLGAEILIDADLCGIESHGIAHLAGHRGYVPGLESGVVKAHPAVRVLRESPVSAAWDGDGGFGLVVSQRAMTAAIEKAESTGMGMVTVRDGRHFGAAGYYARMAAARGLIGMAATNALARAVGPNGLERLLGTNPIAVAAPAGKGPPFLLDMATTTVAHGKLEIAARTGAAIPLGWAQNEEGEESTSALAVREGGALRALGSWAETSAHKGMGLGLVVDILSGVLSGQGPGASWDEADLGMGQWFAAWRVDLFRDQEEFEEELGAHLSWMRGTRVRAGAPSAQVPGDPEVAARAKRERAGVPLEGETVGELEALGTRLGISFPAPV